MLKINEKILTAFFDRLNKGDQLKSLFRAGLNLFLAIAVCSAFFSFSPAFCSETVKEDILTAVEKKYAGKSFEADFTQTATLAALDISEQASGKANFSHPGKMRWQYLEPEHHEIITNGSSLWIYRPQENQVMMGDASQFFKAGAGGAFLSDISLVRKNYTIRVKEITADYVEIDLVAKKKIPEISLIVIRVSQKNNEIQRVTTYNAYDDTTVFEFKNIRFRQVDPDLFEFSLPQGVNIINLDQ